MPDTGVERAAAEYRAVPTEAERLRARVAFLEELVRVKDATIRDYGRLNAEMAEELMALRLQTERPDYMPKR